MRHQKILGKLNMDFMMPEIVNENKINLNFWPIWRPNEYSFGAQMSD